MYVRYVRTTKKRVGEGTLIIYPCHFQPPLERWLPMMVQDPVIGSIFRTPWKIRQWEIVEAERCIG